MWKDNFTTDLILDILFNVVQFCCLYRLSLAHLLTQVSVRGITGNNDDFEEAQFNTSIIECWLLPLCSRSTLYIHTHTHTHTPTQTDAQRPSVWNKQWRWRLFLPSSVCVCGKTASCHPTDYSPLVTEQTLQICLYSGNSVHKVEKKWKEGIKVKVKSMSHSPCSRGRPSVIPSDGGREAGKGKGDAATKDHHGILLRTIFPLPFSYRLSFLCYHGWSRQTEPLSLFMLSAKVWKVDKKGTNREKWEGGWDCICPLGFHHCLAVRLELEWNFWGLDGHENPPDWCRPHTCNESVCKGKTFLSIEGTQYSESFFFLCSFWSKAGKC